jgi:hypothetical protein
MGNDHKLDLGSSNHFKNIAQIIYWEIWEKGRKLVVRPDRVCSIWGARPRSKTRRNFRYLDLRPLPSFPFHITGCSSNQINAISRWVTLLAMGWRDGRGSIPHQKKALYLPNECVQIRSWISTLSCKTSIERSALTVLFAAWDCQFAFGTEISKPFLTSILLHTLLHGTAVRRCLS